MTDNANSSQEVSGPVAFWILASLAAAAVAQPSLHRKKDGSFFGGNIDIVRCIPAVCVIDAFLDLLFLSSAFLSQLSTSKPATRTRQVFPKASVIVVKSVLTIFAVLPQTIKLFSLKGVPATQACGFFFFLATITKLLVDICQLEPEEPFMMWKTTPGEKDTVDLMSPLLFLAVAFQVPFEIWIWYNIGLAANFKPSTEVEDLCLWSNFCCTLLMGVQLLIWAMYAAVRKSLNISAFPYLIPLRGFYLLSTVLGAVKTVKERKESTAFIKPPPPWMNNFSRSMSLMTSAVLFSIAIAKLLDAVGQLIFVYFGPKTSGPSTTSGEPTTDEEPHRKEEETDLTTTKGTFAAGIARGGIIADRWVVHALSLHSTDSVSISLTTFNITTSVLYYLVYFDGTGTDNPSWTSVLG